MPPFLPSTRPDYSLAPDGRRFYVLNGQRYYADNGERVPDGAG